MKQHLLFIIILLFFSCDKSDDIGLSIQPDSDRIILSSYSDSTLFKLTCINEDSIRTDETSLNLLGSYNDPLFGNVISGVASQYRLSSIINTSFGNNVFADSVVLILPYVGYYGDTTQDIAIDVSYLSDEIFIDSAYYSNSDFIPKDLLSSDIYTVSPNTNIYINGDTLPPHLRINLDVNFFEQNILNTDISNLSSNDNFIQHFKGLLLEPHGMNNTVLYFNLLSEWQAPKHKKL